MVFAMSVRLRAARSCGNSCVKLKRLGERMAGHKKRRKMQAETRWSETSRRLRSAHRSASDANTRRSSLYN